MTQDLITIEHLWVYHENTAVLQDINLSVLPNDFLGIIGPNGGGKTTLLKAILGLIKPSQGRISVLGHSPEKARRLIGYVPQYNLYDRDFPITVLDAALMGRIAARGLFRRFSQEDRDLAVEALKTVGMYDFRNQQLGRLSGGEQQRVFIARALISRPKILLLDEPTSSVDSSMQTEFFDLLAELKKDMGIVMVSHDISAVSIYVDTIACLNHRLYYHGSKEIEPEVLEATYECPVQLIAHGQFPHRVLKEH